MTQCDGKDVSCCVSHTTPGVLHEADADNPVMLYS